MNRSKILSLVGILLLLVSCNKNSGSGNSSAPASSQTTSESAKVNSEPTTKPIVFPKTSSAKISFKESLKNTYVSESRFLKNNDDSVFGCLESSDGKSFTFVVKSSSQDKREDFKIQIDNAYFRESRTQYEDLTDIQMDGYTSGFDKLKFTKFIFNTKTSPQDSAVCWGKMDRVKNYLKGTLECGGLVIENNLSKRLDFSIKFACDIIQE